MTREQELEEALTKLLAAIDLVWPNIPWGQTTRIGDWLAPLNEALIEARKLTSGK